MCGEKKKKNRTNERHQNRENQEKKNRRCLGQHVNAQTLNTELVAAPTFFHSIKIMDKITFLHNAVNTHTLKE